MGLYNVIHSIQVTDSCKEIQHNTTMPVLHCPAPLYIKLHFITLHCVTLHQVALRSVAHTRNADKHTWMFNVVERVVIAFLAERSQGSLY